MERKVVLVTGSTRGIGRAIACSLLKDGYHVIINGVSKPEIPESMLSEIKSIESNTDASHEYIQVDISQSRQRKVLLEKIINDIGRIDLLINNSGVAPKNREDILDIDANDFRRVMAVNLEGPFFLTRDIARYMLELVEKGEILDFKPQIINIASISSYTASPSRAAYCLSKAGVSMMTALFAARLKNKIPVFEIRPGIIETDMTKPVIDKYRKMIDAGLIPFNRIGKPEDIANAVIAITRGHFSYSTGNVFNIDGGFHLRRL
ncbi:MAG: 3-ketoacyl-ACP reductase [Promethearchaeota archaeon]